MGQHLDVAVVGGAESPDLIGREPLVHHAVAPPEDDFDFGVLGDVLAEVLVG